MSPTKDRPKRRIRHSSPPTPSRTASFSSTPDSSHRRSTLAHSATLQDREVLTEEDTLTLFEDLQISEKYTKFSSTEPRSFPYSVKQQCWDKAEKVKGRDPDRWRRDPLGNIVFRKLVGCPGCLCHDYDHIVPYSKGGKSTLENCQVLQATVNRSKGNRTELSRADLIQRSSYCRVAGRDMDLIELSAYGNVRHAQESGGCRIQ
ncbi:uncharacterized protein LOC8263418 [Ricinus communis]|uniref:Endonuclease, putative n=1 Tax=Ricinus communis TaxID=3988 RepID=B9RLX6_RICCO|nr:uncharacterized protein LOC8263418 [Ricinus communis]EEF47851.1 endonuclease, putative [Ricinus communis]|eukprot:XP_002514745.1 uncharacterized protein LOC8263418 [Ricinus communis]